METKHLLITDRAPYTDQSKDSIKSSLANQWVDWVYLQELEWGVSYGNWRDPTITEWQRAYAIRIMNDNLIKLHNRVLFLVVSLLPVDSSISQDHQDGRRRQEGIMCIILGECSKTHTIFLLETVISSIGFAIDLAISTLVCVFQCPGCKTKVISTPRWQGDNRIIHRGESCTTTVELWLCRILGYPILYKAVFFKLFINEELKPIIHEPMRQKPDVPTH